MSKLSRAWAEVSRQPLVTAAAVLITVSSLLSALSGRLAFDAQNAVKSAVADRAAELCVASWAAREDTRDMAEAAYRRNAQTLIGLASGDNPEVVEEYKRQVETDVVEIRAVLPDPTCDLQAAQARVASS
jgi:hypothetical protein